MPSRSFTTGIMFERFGLEPPRTFPELMKITETFNQNGIVPLR